MFVTAEKGVQMFIILFLFNQGQAERVQTMKAQTNQPGSQQALFLM